LISRENCEVLDLVVACTATVRAVVADERAVAKKYKICVRVEEGVTGVATEAVYMPSVAS
jgi:hypothetical protein